MLGVEVLPPGTGAPTGFEPRAARSPPAVADPSLPASLSPALFLRSCPPWLPCFPCAACSLQGLSKGHLCGSALSETLVLRRPPAACFQVMVFMCCRMNLVLRGVSLQRPLAGCQQEYPCTSPACKRCSKHSPRESRLGMSLARCSWEAGCLLLRTRIYPRRPHRCCLNPIRKSDLCDLHQLTMA